MLSNFVELGESNHTGGVSSRYAVTDKSHQSHGSRADALNFWIRFGTCDVIDVCPNMIINKSRVISENKTLLRRISQRVIQLGIVTISASEEFRGIDKEELKRRGLKFTNNGVMKNHLGLKAGAWTNDHMHSLHRGEVPLT
ncbi:hypothetical protein RRG08_059200 [Elysia crispata]|uniref:Uncharacterized protein n=1 Tax=Elysia crispata TaxID=231223 RepID=A0AAE0ZEJ5_9GAST|nr:hypothetical protein RRG08_059200 [Elysia crispata]